jgi:hypothetical protein
VLAFGVAGDTLAVTAELRVVHRQQLQPRHRPLTELVDRSLVAEDTADVPVRRDRARIENLDVADRWDLFEFFGFRGHSGEVTEDPSSAKTHQAFGFARSVTRNVFCVPLRLTVTEIVSPGACLRTALITSSELVTVCASIFTITSP